MAREYVLKEVEGEPFVILKNIVILRDFGDSVYQG